MSTQLERITCAPGCRLSKVERHDKKIWILGGAAHFFSLAIEVKLSTRLTVGSVLVRGSEFDPAMSAVSGSNSSAAFLCVL